MKLNCFLTYKSVVPYFKYFSTKPSFPTQALVQKLLDLYSDTESGKQELKWLKQHADTNQTVSLNQLLYRRVIQHEPLQYILGNQPFLNLDLRVQQPILIPRPETEYWVDSLIKFINSKADSDCKLTTLELGVGSGCISLGLASNLKNWKKVDILGVDIDKRAIDLATMNLKLNAEMIGNEVRFFESDMRDFNYISQLLTKLEGSLVVISNPPYIPPLEYAELDQSVKEWESQLALKAEDALGLQYYLVLFDIINKLRAGGIVKGANQHNLPILVAELGSRIQFDELEKINDAKKFLDKLELKSDQFGRPRTLWAWL